MKKTVFLIISVMTMTCSLNAQNPFFEKYNTPHETAPFDKIKNEHYEPAVDKAIKEHDLEIEKIVNNKAKPTFANTVEAFEHSGVLFSHVLTVFYNLLGSESNDEMMEISQRLTPLTTEHSNNINLNKGLFERIKAVYDTRKSAGLTPEQIRLTEKVYESFQKNGANLNEKDKATYRELSAALSKYTLDYGQNVLKESNKYEMLLVNKEDLAGLPENVCEAAAARAKAKGKEGWMFDLSAPSYVAFLKYSSRRDLREKLYLAYTTRCAMGGEFDNQENVLKIAETRMKIAKLFGHSDYATYSLDDKMAKNKENVYALLDNLYKSFAPGVNKDVADVKEYASKMEGKPMEIQAWDWSYYTEKLKDAKYALNEEMIRPYFELENVKKGVFGLATDLYGLTFKKNTEIPVYHPEVEAFDVFDADGKFISVLYTDFHPRDGKRQGAWMSEFKGQYKKEGVDSRPHITIVMNFNRPTETEPALLTFLEAETFLHEFGHALHGMLTSCTYESLSGTNVPRDFVELPSQIMENWLTEKDFLDKFAVHYKTGETIPASVVQKMVDSSNFMAGYACYRQLSFGYLDMAWHTLSDSYTGNVLDFERKAMAKTAVLPLAPHTSTSTSFSHIFSGGYAAGYYGYKWSEVLDADAFAAFKKAGIFDKATATSFRKNILERGFTEEPMTLYVRFRGEEPKVNALLERSGIEVK